MNDQRDPLEAKLRRLRLAAPAPELRARVLGTARRTLKSAAPARPWLAEALLAAAILVMLILLPRLAVSPDGPAPSTLSQHPYEAIVGELDLGDDLATYIRYRLALPRHLEPQRRPVSHELPSYL